jgi:thiamine-phosphate pyrophosphorylase
MSNVLYRIIDANFNRAREALRVLEEYCRFGLNHPGLAGKAKQMRHRLCEAVGKLDSVKLLCSRDVAGDVGKDLKVNGQLRRQSIEDCFTAAAKRASEAFRALAESTQAIDASVAATMEQLRFEVYALEKETVLKAAAAKKWENVCLYVLINATPEAPPGDVLRLCRDCIAGGADCLQLRAKNITDAQFLNLAEAFTTLCKETGIVSIINDRVDIALLSGADGVHLGQNEIPVSKARQLARSPLIVGVSTHNPDELSQAISDGCDYVGLGPAYPSTTKPQLPVAGLSYIRHALPLLEQAGIFHVAIGGINSKNLKELLQVGVKAIAVSEAAAGADDPGGSCKTLKTMLLNPPK